MNILFLMAGEDRSGHKDNNYPVVLTEIHNKPLIQWQIEAAQSIPNAKFIFAIKEVESKKFHLTNVISLLINDANFVLVNEKTQGSACTALMAIQHINSDEPLLILNGDEIVKVNFSEVLKSFEDRGLDAGAVVFNSIHPRYSFLKLDPALNYVVEASEKNPISKNATAGFYYFRRGRDFVAAAQSMIKKGASVEGNYYICPTFNELILNHSKIGVFVIDPSHYIPLKSEANINNLNHLLEVKE
jgi:dTDP-glucose pyrophosphorylase